MSFSTLRSALWTGVLGGVLVSAVVVSGIAYLVDLTAHPTDLVALILYCHAHSAVFGAVAVLLFGVGWFVISKLARKKQDAEVFARVARVLALGLAVVASLSLLWIVARSPTSFQAPLTVIPILLGLVVVLVLAFRAGKEAHASPGTGARPSRLLSWGLLGAAVLVPLLVGLLRPVYMPHPTNDGNDAVVGMRAKSPRLLLVGWDAATWDIADKLLAEGRLPTLQRILDEGVRGQLMARTQPIQPFASSASGGARSPALWETIATGKPPELHGIWDFQSTMLPGLRKAIPFRFDYGLFSSRVPTTSEMARAERLWYILDRAGMRTLVVGWFNLWPARRSLESGIVISERIGKAVDETAYPPGAAALFQVCEGTEEEATRFARELFGAAADPDSAYERELVDTFIREYARDLCNTLITEELIAIEQPEFVALYLSLTDIVQHKFWRFYEPELFGDLENRNSPYGKAIPAAYEELDRLLARVLEAAGEKTTLVMVSDHGAGPWLLTGLQRVLEGSLRGFHEDYSGNHRLNGVLLMRGEGIRVGATVPDAEQVDVVPTVLHLLGFPYASDMTGRVIEEAFQPSYLAEFSPSTVSTYQVPDSSGDLLPTASDVDTEIDERLRSLGYIQ